ncbi:hypothetical protein JCM8547_005992 [Rhodosporidiobolus lusitaniae]
MWTVRNRTLLLLLALVGVYTFFLSTLPELSLLATSTSPTDSPALNSLTVVHRLAKRSGKVGGLAALVQEAERMVAAAEREGSGKGQKVEESCSGWVATLEYCNLSSTEDGGMDCFCSSTALDRMAVCRTALPELKSAFVDFVNVCGTATLADDLSIPPLHSSSRRRSFSSRRESLRHRLSRRAEVQS